MPLEPVQREALLKVARRVIEASVKGEAIPTFDSKDLDFQAKRGAFVTIKNGDRLRGCIGHFEADKPLIEAVCEMARAATRDPRFIYQPLTPRELPQCDIEISVLTPREKTDDPGSLELGKHGIYIQGPSGQAGCFLPQVAVETGWSKGEFLGNCCSHKAGLAPDAWKNPDTDVYLFEAEIFGEKGD